MLQQKLDEKRANGQEVEQSYESIVAELHQLDSDLHALIADRQKVGTAFFKF
jgi:hypothetical protein